MTLRVGLLGGGSWGTTVASLVAKNAPIRMWARNGDTVDEINRHHTNGKYLPDAQLPDALEATTDLEEVVRGADLVVMGIPSQHFRSVLEDVKTCIRPWVPIVSLSKGLELSTGMRMTEIIGGVLPGHPAGVLSGPNLAREVMSGYAAASVVAMESDTIAKELQNVFHSGLFRVYSSNDVLGCEIGGVLKNIMAIAAGMGDGMGAGVNTRSAVITRGLSEITRLALAMGAKAETLAGLAGMGDLIATCTSPQSRNRTVGFELGRGKTLKQITDEMFMVAEGVKSAPAVIALADEYDVDMPIAREVYETLQGTRTPEMAFRGLIRRPVGAEWQPER